jgi:TPR repeat protein
MTLKELNNTEAMNNIGMMYQNGIGVEKREKRATKWFSKSADKEDPFGTR